MTAPGRVLVVDDNAMSRRTMAMAVRKVGHDWVEAEDGEAAMAQMEAQDFDLVLLDIVMPGLDGFGVLERMRVDPRLAEVPVLVISGMDDDTASVARAIELGAADFLPKSFDPVLFRARVGACIEKRRLRVAELDYLAQVDRLAAAAAVMEEQAFHPKNLGLEPVAARDDAVGRLARVFAEMAQQVYDRERALQRRIRTAKGVVLLILAGIVGGLSTPLSVILFEEIPLATGLTFWSDLLPGLLCIALAAATRRLGRIPREALPYLTLWAVLNVLAGICIFEAAGRVTGIVLSILLALEGLLVFLIAAILRIEDASARRLIGLLLGLAGVVMLIVARESSDGSNAWIWVLFALSVPLLWAVTDILIAARGASEALDPIAGLGVMYLISAAVTLPLAAMQGQFFLIGPEIGWVSWLIIFNAVVDMANYVLYVILIGIAGAVFGSQSAYVSTLAGILWSIVLLGEVLTGPAMAALGLVLVGLLVVGPKSEAADLEVQFVPRARRRSRRKVLPWS